MTAAPVPAAAALSAATVVTVCGVALPPPVVPVPTEAHPTSALGAGGVVQFEPPVPVVPAAPVPAAPPRPAVPAPPVPAVPVVPPRATPPVPAVPLVPAPEVPASPAFVPPLPPALAPPLPPVPVSTPDDAHAPMSKHARGPIRRPNA